MTDAEQLLNKKQHIKDAMDRILPKEKSDALWKKAAARLHIYLTRFSSLPAGVRVHTHRRILPAAAVYLILKQEIGQEQAFRLIEESSALACEKIEKPLHRLLENEFMQKMFVRMWNPVAKILFGPANGFQNIFYPSRKGEFRMDVTACPYFRYFSELGCSELTKIFCENDNRIYGTLPGLKFERAGTLGKGAERCDFRIRRL